MTKHFRIIFPTSHHESIWQYVCQHYANILPNAQLSAAFLQNAQPSVVSEYDQFQIACEMLDMVQHAEQDQCDGVFINIAFDTSLSAAKTLVKIPVVGALEAAILLAKYCQFQKITVLAINNEEVPVNYRLFREYDYFDRLVSIESLNIPVFSLQDDKVMTIERVMRCCEKAYRIGADCIILGCTAMGWIAKNIRENFDIQVIDTSVAGLVLLDLLTELKLSQNQSLFVKPSNLKAVKNISCSNTILTIPRGQVL